MSRVYNLAKVFLVFLTIHLTVVCGNSRYMNPEWVDPHDYTADKDPVQSLCPLSDSCKPCEDTAKTEYLRLVNTLFNPSEFKFDESTNFLYRTVHIHITKAQMDKLKRLSEPIQIDGLLAEVLSQNEFGTVQLVKEYTVDVVNTIWDRIPTIPDINFNSLPRSRPIFINFGISVAMYFVCRRFNISYLIYVFFALSFVLYEYLDDECHRRIELNEAVEFIYGKEKNPCKGTVRMNWFDWVVGRDSRSACRDFLDRQSAHKTQCSVVDLFHEFIANVLMKQLKLFFMTIADLVRSISTTNGILITAVTLYFMKGLLVTIIQSVFKYILNPSVWSRVASDLNTTPPAQQPPQQHAIPVPVQRMQSVTDSDIRDVQITRVLDLANQHMQLLLEDKRMAMAQNIHSGIEILAVKAQEPEPSTSNIAETETKNESENTDTDTTESQTPTEAETSRSSECTASFEDIAEEDNHVIPPNISVVSINDTQPSEISSEYSQSMSPDGAHLKLNETSYTTSMTSESMKSLGDSIEILSISSDTTAP